MPAERLRKAAGRPSERAAGARVAVLFEEHGRMVYGVCRLLLRDREDAEDATQQTFLSAYRSLLGGTEPEEPAAWLGTIARNECRGRIRARTAVPLAVVEAPEPGNDVDELAHQHEEVTALLDILAELPPHQREAIVLREFYGLSHEEVGHALGVTPSAVDSLLVRARRRLQSALRPARLASGALVLPLALRESLAQAMPGFGAAAGGGGVAKVVSLPIAAKLTATAATVAAVGVVAGSQPPPPPPAAKQAPASVEAPGPAPKAPSAPPLPRPPAPEPEPRTARPIADYGRGEDDAEAGQRQHQVERDEVQRNDDDAEKLAKPGVDDRGDREPSDGRRQQQDDAEDADEPEAGDGDEGSERNDSDDADAEEESEDGDD